MRSRVCGERAGCGAVLSVPVYRRGLSAAACIINVVAGGAAVCGVKQGD